MVKYTVNYKIAKFLTEETVLYRGIIYAHIKWILAILYYFRLLASLILIIRYINITLDCILSRDRQSNQNCKCNYGTISINILLLPTRRLGKVTALN